MYVLLMAVLTASLLGSMHCVGMCGPLAIFASGAGDGAPRRQVVTSTLLYHLGRLTTYMLAGMIAGAVGSILDAGGQTLGLQLAAARVVGSAMVAIGIYKLVQPFLDRYRPVPMKPLKPSRISGLLVKLRPHIHRLSPANRAFTTGLLTTLLPCGWLYLFALIAAGTGSVFLGPLVMFSFWLGTVPALTALISGTVALSGRFKRATPFAAAILLVFAGCFTITGRGFANLTSLDQIQQIANIDATSQPAEMLDAPLPCCENIAVTPDPPKGG